MRYIGARLTEMIINAVDALHISPFFTATSTFSSLSQCTRKTSTEPNSMRVGQRKTTKYAITQPMLCYALPKTNRYKANLQ